MTMTAAPERISKDLLKDFKRNREGRLSSRQWLELITEPLTSLLLLSVPLALLLGRYGMAGRLLVVALIIGFLVTVALRALRFSRVNLCYRVLYLEEIHPRWRFWRKTSFASKSGEQVRFHKRIASKIKLQPESGLCVYYFDFGQRRVLVSMIPEEHPKADLAEPSASFVNRGGRIFAD